jgi:hypothetical protein
MISTQCPAALSQRETAAEGETRDKSRIEFPVYFLPWQS